MKIDITVDDLSFRIDFDDNKVKMSSFHMMTLLVKSLFRRMDEVRDEGSAEDKG